MTLCKKIMVIGTDTDVGKTVLSLLIMQVLTAKGKNPFYVKPFQTGCVCPSDTMGDAAFIHRHTPGLGTINHTLMTVECLKARGIIPGGIVFMDTQQNGRVSKIMIQENMEAVERFSGVPVAGIVESINDFQNPDPDALKTVDRLLKYFHFY